ncbi:MAG: hypothetical protein V1824_04200 [archaeon]
MDKKILQIFGLMFISLLLINTVAAGNIEKKILDKDKIKAGAFKLKLEFKNRDDCVEFSQADFNYTQDVLIEAASGCVELIEPINFNHTIMIADGSDDFYFTCNGYTISGETETGLYVVDQATVKNCNVAEKENGYYLQDNAKVENSNAHNNTTGFYLIGDTTGTENLATENNVGFYLWDNSEITDSNATSNEIGFSSGMYSSNSKISNSYSGNNNLGYYLMSYAEAHNSIAGYNNVDGFRLIESSKIFNCTAKNNVGIGIDLHDESYAENSLAKDNYNGIVQGYESVTSSCTAKNNTNDGFLVKDYTLTLNPIASNNEYGIYMQGDSEVSGGVATNNNKYGYYLKDTALVYDAKAKYNGIYTSSYGFYLDGNSTAQNVLSNSNKNGIYVTRFSKLLNGYEVCFNGARNIFAYFGTITGTYKSTAIGGAGYWPNAIIIPCGPLPANPVQID